MLEELLTYRREAEEAKRAADALEEKARRQEREELQKLRARVEELEASIPKVVHLYHSHHLGYLTGETSKKEMEVSAERLKQFYERVHSGRTADEMYNQIMRELQSSGIRCDLYGFQHFTEQLNKFQHEQNFPAKAGIFLSALINHFPLEAKAPAYCGIQIDLRKLVKRIRFLGMLNTKQVMPFGNLGDYFGYKMAAGTLYLEGIAGKEVGHGMTGGRIVIVDGFEGISKHFKGGEIYDYNKKVR